MTIGAADLAAGRLDVLGQLVAASNASLLCRLTTAAGDQHRVIYKPRAGERPLWDFPVGTLSQREVAARVVSEALGWEIVPATVWRDGPYGPGMVQEWVDVDPGVDPVALVQGEDPQLRRIAVFDALVNNADRKGGHLLADPHGHIWGIDHGVTFASTDKLRTVLWQWRGQCLTADTANELRTWLHAWDSGESWALNVRSLLSDEESTALGERCRLLLETGRHPQPSPDWPPIPWPPF